jgi:hypothetical protein
MEARPTGVGIKAIEIYFPNSVGLVRTPSSTPNLPN